MISGRRIAVLLAGLVVASAGLLIALRPRQHNTTDVRSVPMPIAQQRAFQQFADSTGPFLLDTLFVAGFHGGYSWDEKSGPKLPNLIVRPERQTASDSAQGIFEGTFTLDFHHDTLQGVPSTVSLRFASVRGSPKWTLLTTDGFPEDVTPDIGPAVIQQMPAQLHAALRAAFADHAEAFDFWKSLETRTRDVGRQMSP